MAAAYSPLGSSRQFHTQIMTTSDNESQDAQQTPYFSQPIEIDEPADYVLVFPLSPEDLGDNGGDLTENSFLRRIKSDLFRPAGSHWQRLKMDCLESAEAIFRPRLLGENGLFCIHEFRQIFDKDMTERQYQDAIRDIFVKIVASHKCGFKLRSCPSIDNDEVFLMVSLPDLDDDYATAGTGSKEECRPAAQQIAARIGLRVPLREDVYNRVGKGGQNLLKLITDRYGRAVVAHQCYIPGKEDWFQEFNAVHRIRMVYRRISDFVVMEELSKQGIVVAEFPSHDWSAICAFEKDFANVCKFWRPLVFSYSCDDDVRQYFGEEIAFFFSWATFFTRSLVFAALGSLITMVCVHCPILELQTWAPVAFAAMMACYATTTNELFDRVMCRNIQRWGMRDYHHVAAIRASYDSKKDNEYIQMRLKFFSTLLCLLYICLIAALVLAKQYFQWELLNFMEDWFVTKYLLKHGYSKQKVAHIVQQTFMGILSVQIVIMDAIWKPIAIKLTQWENHKTKQKHAHSLVNKLVPVQLFNYLFTFLYIAFLKPLRGRCHPDLDGCITELRGSVTFFFIMRSSLTIYYLVSENLRVKRELRLEVEKMNGYGRMTYSQVQAKLALFSGLEDDYMNWLAEYTIIACFTQVFLSLSFVSLFTNLIEIRLLAYRHVYAMKRNYPTGVEGIGAWHDVLKVVAKTSTIVNCGLAVFLMKPLRDYSLSSKFLIFVLSEHCLLFVKTLIESVIESQPHDVIRIEETNNEVVGLLLGDIDDATKPVCAQPQTQPKDLDISCDMIWKSHAA